MTRRRSTTAVLFAAALLAPAVGGCKKKIQPAECAAMLDRYIGMIVDDDPATRSLPPERASAIRETRRAAKKAEANYAHVQGRCEAEVTRPEYDCAMASKNANEWEACIE